jgi:hypothetical protein
MLHILGLFETRALSRVTGLKERKKLTEGWRELHTLHSLYAPPDIERLSDGGDI